MAALISTFELLVKRIAPLTPSPVINAPFRRVVQGYFLTIANPSDRRVNFRVRYTYPRNSGIFPTDCRELVSGNANTRNHLYTYDITGGSNNGQLRYEDTFPNASTPDTCGINRTANLGLPSCQTASLNLVPDITSAAVDLANPCLEIRGYADIVQLQNVQIVCNGLFCQIIFTDPDPVELIVTPEIRGTFLDNNYPDFTGGLPLDFDQIAYALPPCEGGACITVSESVNPFFTLDIPDPDDIVIELTRGITGGVDLAGRFRIDNKSLRRMNTKINKYNRSKKAKAELSLRHIQDMVEGYINDGNAEFIKDDKKRKK